MSVVFERTKLLTDKTFHYCPGCNHGIIHRLVAESIEELEKEGVIEEGKVIGVAPVGCSVFAYDYFNCDMYEAAHGRAPAVATGAKRVVGKDTLVFTYQGDGDLASIGTAEIVHAAHRGEHICTIFVNNAIYGMTGGQMAPTTLVGQKTTTSPKGRDEAWCGAPIRVAEMLSTIPGSYYIERCAVNNNANIMKTKKLYCICSNLCVLRENVNTILRLFRIHLLCRTKFFDRTHHSVTWNSTEFSFLDLNSTGNSLSRLMSACNASTV